MSKSRMGIFSGNKNPMYGRNHSQDSKTRMSETRKLKNKTRDNPNKGRVHSEEARKNMSAAAKKRGCFIKNPSKKIAQIDLTTGEIVKIWNNARDIGEFFTGTRHNSIHKVCKRTNGSNIYKGFRWEFTGEYYEEV